MKTARFFRNGPAPCFVLFLTLPLMAGCVAGNALSPSASVGSHDRKAALKETAPPVFPEKRTSSEDPNVAAQFCQTAAEEYAAAGKTSEAIAMFEQAEKHDPSLADRNAHRLAVLHAEAGNAAQARSLFQRAIRADPRNADLHNDFGYFLLTRGDTDDARARFEAARKLAPNHPQATMNLGLLRAEAGARRDAESLFTSIVGRETALQNISIFASDREHTHAQKSVTVE